MPGPFGVYVHFPWCTHRCPYCDFAVTTARPIPSERYARAVVAEIARRAPAFAGGRCETLYVGGGTPSLWEPEHLARVIRAVRALGLPGDAEVTVEANPESAGRALAEAWRDAGVTRVSIGVQSFDAAVLHKLGRRHSPAEAERAIREVASVIPDVSIDLIYGGRRSTVETARQDARRAAGLPVTHVSAYGLTLDTEVLAEEVPLARLAHSGRLAFPGDDEQLAQGRAIREVLAAAGFRRYEISNLERGGHPSRHNLVYWRSQDYLGVGAGATGCLHAGGGARRWTNHRDVAAWLAAAEAGAEPSAEEERLGPAEVANERVMLGLRLAEGIPLEGLDAAQVAEVPRLVAAGLATADGGRLRLTDDGMDVHSAVAERLFTSP